MNNLKLSKSLAIGLNPRPTVKSLERLWSDVCKARDGYKSQYRDEPGALVVHHILKKPNFRLRFELDNGITITNGQHQWVAHGPGNRAEEFLKWSLGRLPTERKQALIRMKHQTGSTTDLWAVKLFLDSKLKEYTK